MEVDFDKEIDAILRNVRAGAPVLSGETASLHLDADELSAFAENAMPESAKRLYTVHLAECDRCRKILSEIILMNAEEEPASMAATAAPVAAESFVPWYRKLLLYPNLAYVMGTLVLVFSGFLGYLVLQNAGGDSTATYEQISQTQEDQLRTAGGPSYEEPMYPAASANTNANAAVSTANANAANAAVASNAPANTAAAPAETEKLARRDEMATLDKTAAAADRSVTADGVALAPPPPAAAPMAATGAKPAANEADTAAKKKEDEAEEAKVLSERSVADLPQVDRQKARRSAGPLRNQQNQFPNRAENQYAVVPKRTVGGKTFEQKESVWYDTAYTGQATTNVRRNSDAFEELDSGLRSIASNLSGTVVVIWKGKAYRIQ